ncbi:hypothetical protein LP420_12360 [Massilia sp. B-10]|nr:hypothetical protein LP420_12360 [Massilia sp. B-10]
MNAGSVCGIDWAAARRELPGHFACAASAYAVGTVIMLATLKFTHRLPIFSDAEHADGHADSPGRARHADSAVPVRRDHDPVHRPGRPPVFGSKPRMVGAPGRLDHHPVAGLARPVRDESVRPAAGRLPAGQRAMAGAARSWPAPGSAPPSAGLLLGRGDLSGKKDPKPVFGFIAALAPIVFAGLA